MKPEKPQHKSSIIYFQIGLIVALLGTMFLLNNETEVTLPSHASALALENDIMPKALSVQLPENKIKKTKKQSKKKQKTTKTSGKIKIADHPFLPEGASKNDDGKDPVLKSIDHYQKIEDPVVDKPAKLYDITKVERLPVFPGCENYMSKDERAACFSAKIGRLVQRYYDSQLAEGLQLSGPQKIYVTFTIDEYGEVKDIKARSAYQVLAKEAVRVVKKIPKMIPARQQDENVPVRYSLPIRFNVR